MYVGPRRPLSRKRVFLSSQGSTSNSCLSLCCLQRIDEQVLHLSYVHHFYFSDEWDLTSAVHVGHSNLNVGFCTQRYEGGWAALQGARARRRLLLGRNSV